MPNIIISEIDETTPGVNSESFEVVYVPGCVDTSQKDLYNRDGDYIGLAVKTPTLFTSVSQFEALCGTKGLTFTKDQDYRSLLSSNSNGFASDAIPFDNIMFREGELEPGYVLAKELLAAGLNVLFERINNDNDTEEFDTTNLTVDERNDFAANPSSYVGVFNNFVKIEDSTPPEIYRIENQGVCVLVPQHNLVDFDSDVVYYIKGANGDFSENTDESPDPDKVYYTIDNNRKFFDLNGTTTTEPDDLSNYVECAQVIFNGALVPVLYAKKLTEVPTNWDTDYWKSYGEFVPTELNIGVVFSELSDDDTPSLDDLIKAKINIKHILSGAQINTVYAALEGIYDSSNPLGLADKGNYSIKYVTSGGYPVFEYNNNTIVDKMIELAKERGDCVAIIDHTENLDRIENINLEGSLYKAVSSSLTFQDDGQFGTMFTPWATYNRTTVDYEYDSEGNKIPLASTPLRMPASFAYLTCLADSIKTNAPWLAIAGSARGVVGNLASNGITQVIPNGAADKMQPREGIAVNAITNIKPYGYTIWGNRTLKKNSENLVATSFLNIRNLVSDVKKTVYSAARALTFEQNNEVLWVNFKSRIAPTLDRMLSGYGISGYKIVRDLEHPKAAEKATICAKIILYPVYAVEDFYITIVLRDNEISVESAN